MQCILFLLALLLCCEEDAAQRVENKNVREQLSFSWWQWPCYKIFLVNQIKVSGCLGLCVVCGYVTGALHHGYDQVLHWSLCCSGHCHLPSHRKHSSPVSQGGYLHHQYILSTQPRPNNPVQQMRSWKDHHLFCVNFSCNKADNMASNFLFRCVSVWQEMTSLLGKFC